MLGDPLLQPGKHKLLGNAFLPGYGEDGADFILCFSRVAAAEQGRFQVLRLKPRGRKNKRDSGYQTDKKEKKLRRAGPSRSQALSQQLTLPGTSRAFEGLLERPGKISSKALQALRAAPGRSLSGPRARADEPVGMGSLSIADLDFDLLLGFQAGGAVELLPQPGA